MSKPPPNKTIAGEAVGIHIVSQKQRHVPNLEANDERQTTVGRSNST